MGAINLPSPVLLIIAATSRYEDALDLARQQCEERFGATQAVSEAFDFSETDYYAAEMGAGLLKQFWAFDLIDPARLPAVKRQTNEWEADYAALGRHPETRPLNLDPGYVTLAKLVLASTKDHAHRIYLSHGIYAEVTLSYRGGVWQPFAWTYPDYRREDFQVFFTHCRDLLRRHSGKN